MVFSNIHVVRPWVFELDLAVTGIRQFKPLTKRAAVNILTMACNQLYAAANEGVWQYLCYHKEWYDKLSKDTVYEYRRLADYSPHYNFSRHIVRRSIHTTRRTGKHETIYRCPCLRNRSMESCLQWNSARNRHIPPTSYRKPSIFFTSLGFLLSPPPPKNMINSKV